MSNAEPSMLKPALIGGGIAGVVLNLPGLSLIVSCTCCLIVMSGGFLAAYLQSQQCRAVGAPFGPSSGALVGLIAGPVYGVAGALTGTLMGKIFGFPFYRALIEAMTEFAQEMPDSDQLIDTLDQLREGLDEQAFGVFALIYKVFMGILVGALFCTLGGVIGGAVFKHEPPVPPVPTQPSGPSEFDAPPPPASPPPGGSQEPPQSTGS